MTAKEAIKILEVAKAECEWSVPLEYQEAFDMAIEALRQQGAADIEPKQPGIDSILTKMDQNDEAIRKDDHIAESDKMVDQFREVTKKTNDVLLNRDDVIKAVDRHTREDGTLDDDISCILEEVSLLKQEKSNSFSKEPSEDGIHEMNCSDVPDMNVGKIEFKRGWDAISRPAAIEEVCNMMRECFGADDEMLDALKTTLNELTTIYPEPKTGRWIPDEIAAYDMPNGKPRGWVPWLCSECGYCVGKHQTRFCPDCGALMCGKAK